MDKKDGGSDSEEIGKEKEDKKREKKMRKRISEELSYGQRKDREVKGGEILV